VTTTFIDRFRDAELALNTELRAIGVAEKERKASVAKLVTFCAPFASRAAIISERRGGSSTRMSTAADGLRRAADAIERALQVSSPPWIVVPRDVPIPPADEFAHRLVVTGSVEEALRWWADALVSKANDAPVENGLTREQRRRLRSLHTSFRLIFLRLALRTFGTHAHGLGAALYGVTFDTDVDSDAYRKALARDKARFRNFADFVERHHRTKRHRTKRG
jgi:hypothetical protein